MEIDLVFSNIQDTEALFPDAFEMRFSHLSEAAFQLLPDESISENELQGVLADVGQAFISSLQNLQRPQNEIADLNYKEMAYAISGVHETDMAIFASRVSRLLVSRKISVFPEARSLSLPYKIAYVPNPTAAAVFRKMATYIPHVLPYHCDSFLYAAEAVEEGSASACLLPFEDANYHRISTSLSILDRFGFRFAAGETSEPEGGMYFVLLTDGDMPINGGNRFFSCRYIPHKNTMPGNVMRAAALFGLSPVSVSTERFPDSDKTSCFLTASLNEDSDPAAFLTYLYLFSASTVFYGIYRAKDVRLK